LTTYFSQEELNRSGRQFFDSIGQELKFGDVVIIDRELSSYIKPGMPATIRAFQTEDYVGLELDHDDNSYGCNLEGILTGRNKLRGLWLHAKETTRPFPEESPETAEAEQAELDKLTSNYAMINNQLYKVSTTPSELTSIYDNLKKKFSERSLSIRKEYSQRLKLEKEKITKIKIIPSLSWLNSLEKGFQIAFYENYPTILLPFTYAPTKMVCSSDTRLIPEKERKLLFNDTLQIAFLLNSIGQIVYIQLLDPQNKTYFKQYHTVSRLSCCLGSFTLPTESLYPNNFDILPPLRDKLQELHATINMNSLAMKEPNYGVWPTSSALWSLSKPSKTSDFDVSMRTSANPILAGDRVRVIDSAHDYFSAVGEVYGVSGSEVGVNFMFYSGAILKVPQLELVDPSTPRTKSKPKKVSTPASTEFTTEEVSPTTETPDFQVGDVVTWNPSFTSNPAGNGIDDMEYLLSGAELTIQGFTHLHSSGDCASLNFTGDFIPNGYYVPLHCLRLVRRAG